MKIQILAVSALLMVLSIPAWSQSTTSQVALGGPKFSGWTGLGKSKNGVASLPIPGEASFLFTGEADKNQRDWYGAFGVRFDVELADENPVRLDVKLLADQTKNASQPQNTSAPTTSTPTTSTPTTSAPTVLVPTASVLIAGKGWHTVSLPWREFGFRQSFAGFLSSMQGLSIAAYSDTGTKGRISLRSPQVVRGDKVWLQADVRGKSVMAGGIAQYSVLVGNPTQALQGVTLAFEKSGYDAMKPAVSPSSLVLKAGETKEVTVRVEVPARIPAGGHETQTLRAIGNGGGSPFDKIEFVTASKLDYPNILHTGEGWEEVRANIAKYDWAKSALEDYRKRADVWNVPAVKNLDNPKRGDWLFATQEEANCFAAGVSYQGTLDNRYAEKVKTFLVRLSDPKNGYPVTLRACNQASVQEGAFFQHLVMAYDMTIPSGVYSAADREQIDATLRLFIGPQKSVSDQISNWDVSYLCGQFYASLAVQDLASAQRFLYAPHGIIEQMVRGTLNDGWWYELSISYNTWVAGEFSQVAIALQPWGYDLANARFPANYRSDEETLPQNEEYGMSKAQWGPIHTNWTSIKKMWDVLPRVVDYRSVMFGLNDSAEMNVAGYRNELGARPLELAYYLYRDPAYATIIKNSGEPRDLIYGVPDLPANTPDLSAQSTYADNAGVAVLRSKAEGKEARERIQAVLRYGDHGWYHGHFDIGDLVHLSRYGRSFFNPELIWFGYPNFMYKFYVQTSISKNMVVVDQKMQEPTPSQRLLFHSGPMMQASAIQVNARWSNPPYGGMKYDDQTYTNFADKAFAEGRSVPTPLNPPPYTKFGSVTDYTEPILQRRLVLVTDDYVVLADYLKGTKEHTFESLFQMKGFQGLDSDSRYLVRHDGQWSTDPLSSAQFVTDADWWKVSGPARSRWHFLWGEGGDEPGRNEPGILNLDLHTLWPPQQELMIATAPENVPVNRQVSYAIRGDGKTLKTGQTGTWILGQVDVDVPLTGVHSLELETQSGATNPGTLFWAGASVVTSDGRELPLSQFPMSFDNAMQPKAQGQDFAGGPIKIAGIPYQEAVSAQPQDGKKPCIVRVDLSGVKVVRLKGVLGGDYPVGDEAQRRKIEAVRSSGTEARFLTLIEPFEDKRMVKSATAVDANTLRVELVDGRVQDIKISGLDGDGTGIQATIADSHEGRATRTETTSPNP